MKLRKKWENDYERENFYYDISIMNFVCLWIYSMCFKIKLY